MDNKKKQKGEIKRLGEFSKRIVDNAPISIITIDKNGIITFVNEFFWRLSRTRSPLGQNMFKIPFFIKEKLNPLYKKILKDGIPFKKDGCYTKNLIGESKYINITAVPLKDFEGKIEGVLSMAVDVTELIITKKKLKKLNSKLEAKVAKRTLQLCESNKKLIHSLESKAQFISDAFHEIITPLTIIKLNLDIARKKLFGKKLLPTYIFKNTEDEINKISEILKDIAMLTTMNEETEKIEFKKVSVVELVGSVVKRLKSLSNEKEIKINWKKNKNKLIIKGDKTKLEKLILNIVRNAVKYGKREGWIRIWAKQDLKNKMVKINVSDNGIGIPEKDIQHIFNRFYRTDISRSKGKGGFGLGLAICKWIAGQHKGFIEVSSTLGKGSIFTINLPIDPEKIY